MIKKQQQTVFDMLMAMFCWQPLSVQAQDILRLVQPKIVNALHFKLVVRPNVWRDHDGDFPEISIMRNEMHYVNVLYTKGTFSDMIHATTFEDALDAIYKYMANTNVTPSKLFGCAGAFALALPDEAKIRVHNCIDRIIMRDLSVKERTELHFIQSETNMVTLKLYVEGEMIFCTVPRTEEDLVNKATYVLFGGGPVEDALPKLFRDEVKMINQMLEKHNVGVDAKTITFNKEDFFAFVGDLLKNSRRGR